MDKLRNGWTKKAVMERIEEFNSGKCVKEGSTTCLYRGPDGNRCLIGCFIPDELYSKDMEGLSAWTVVTTPGISECMPFYASDAGDFQRVHDNSPDDVNKETLHKRAQEWLDANFED